MIEVNDIPLFSFVILGDTHITDDESKSVDAHTTRTVTGKFDALLDKIAALDPAFVIHLGDITHPGPMSGDYAKAAREFFDMSARIGRPWHLVPGNHDIGEKLHRALPEIDESLTISECSIAQYQQHFGPQYHSFEHNNCAFILINALLINSGLPDETEQWDWLEETLSASAGKRIFVCSHYPMFLTAEHEATHYDNIDQPGRTRLAALMRSHGVEGFYSGHVHNFFYNRLGEMHHFTLPSTSIMRHDYLEFFRTAPESREMGRYDPAKTGFFWIDVYENGHVPHLIRQSAPDTRRTHTWRDTGAMPVMDLRVPWCERQDVACPWGAEIFERKRVRSDYPLSALWEMGIRDLRIPVSDLEEPETETRVRDLAALGHRFTVVMFGMPDARRVALLESNVAAIQGIEIVAIQQLMSAHSGALASLRDRLGRPVYLNPVHTEVQGYTSTHGVRIDCPADIEWLSSEAALRRAVDGFVVGVSKHTHPLDGLQLARDIVGAYRTRFALHVQNVGMYRTTAPTDRAARCHELNRVAEAAMIARANPDIPVLLDNFVELDRGYFHCFGLVDRLYNPQAGSRILTSLDAVLPAMSSALVGYRWDGMRVLAAQSDSDKSVMLLLPGTGLSPDSDAEDLPPGHADLNGLFLDLVSGAEHRGSLSEFPTGKADAVGNPILFKPEVDPA